MSNLELAASERQRRKVLGRGLGALLESRTTTGGLPTPPGIVPGPAADAAPSLRQIPLEAIEPNPNQPRKKFPKSSLEELAESIRAHGLLQPILVPPVVTPTSGPGATGRFQLVAGERRWRAAQLAGLRTVPALVEEVRKEQSLELALVENLQREDLNPLEAATAFERLTREFGLKHEEVARRTGKDRATITNLIRLLKLPAEVQQLLAEAKLTVGHAKALLGLTSADTQCWLAAQIVSRDLSVRMAEKLVAQFSKRGGIAPPKPPKAKQWDANIRAALLELEHALGTRVRLSGTPRKGALLIEYHSAEELIRLYDKILHK